MDNAMLLKGIIAIVVVLAALPFVPTVLDALKSPDPALDGKNLERLQQEIQAYGDDTGYYPASLASLVPDYLEAVPRTHDGKAFTYNAQTGMVGLPGAVTSSAARDSGNVGLTPVGDAFTGLSVQNELNF